MPSTTTTNRSGSGVHSLGSGPEPIAIAGMGCRLPGDVRDIPSLWELLKNKKSGYRKFGDHRFNLGGFHHPNSDRPGTIATEGGLLLSEDPRLFDHSFFGMTALEVETMDPSQRKLLEVVYEAFENAGVTWDEFSGSRTGVYVGNFSSDHSIIQQRDSDHPRPYAGTGGSMSILSNRVNYILNLHGPSVTIDTACSSSMYALHLAVAAIRNGDCDAAIVAACNTIMDPGIQLMMAKLGVLSATSTCHTFDAAADGYARGEGFAALYLRKVDDAVAGHLPIRAVIRGTAINANGRTGGITHPSAQGQEAVIRKAYENAGNLPLDDTTYFECHGTGTPVGDPIEISAIGGVFSTVRTPEDPLLIGSVKTNLGHTEACSAIAGIMKVVLAFETGLIPPSIGIRKLNPNIDFRSANVRVLTDVTRWPEGKLKRASVNSFGYGGANAHCILDHVHNILPNYVKPGVLQQHPARTMDYQAAKHFRLAGVPNSQDQGAGMMETSFEYGDATGSRLVKSGCAATRQLVLLPFSGHNDASLKLNIAAMRQVIDRHLLADVAYTLSAKRTRFMQRGFCIVDGGDPGNALDQPRETFTVTAQASRLGFVFTGQGAQWHRMGAELFQYRVFEASVRYLDHVLAGLPIPPSWTVESVLRGHSAPDRVHIPEVSQTICTAVQVGLVDLLWSWKICPSAVVGHSSGEIAAAYSAGRITKAQAIVAAYLRGQAVSRNRLSGLMLAVGLSLGDVEPYMAGLEDKIKIAAINSPSSVTLSGDATAVRALAEKLTKRNVFNRVVQTGGNAYHSHHMQPIGRLYHQTLTNGLEHVQKNGLANEELRYPQVAWLSSVRPHKKISEVAALGASYWRMNLESPVRFSEAVSNMVTSERAPVDVLVEIGPHSALKGPLQQILNSVDRKIPYLPSLKRGEDGQVCMLLLAGRLFGLNARLDLVAVNAVDKPHVSQLIYEHGCLAIDLPPYKYAYGPINYYENRFSKEFRQRSVVRHDLLGSKLPGNAKLRPQWRNILRLKDLPWLQDHCLLPYPVFPAAGHVAIALEAASQTYNDFDDSRQIRGFSLRNFSIKTPLRIPDDDRGVEIITTMDLTESATANSPAWVRCTISSVSHETSVWTEHCNGLVKVELADSFSVDQMATRMDARAVDAKAWNKHFARIGLEYGPTFQGLSGIQADPAQDLAIARVSLQTTRGTVAGGESRYPLHPASLDAVFQLGLIACHGGQMDKARVAFVPVHIKSLYLKNGGRTKDEWRVAIARGELRGLRAAYTTLQMVDDSGDVVLDIPSMRCVALAYSDQGHSSTLVDKPFSSPVFKLEWKPDIRTVRADQANKMFPPPQSNVDRVHLFDIFDRLCTLMVAEVDHRFGDNVAVRRTSDIQHFLDWCRRRLSDRNQWVDEAKALSRTERVGLIDRLVGETRHFSDIKVAWELFSNMDEIMYGRKTGLDIIVPNGLLTSLYDKGVMMTGAYQQLSHLFEAIGHASPSLRILEIGAGTGSATRIIMKALTAVNGIKRYKDYTFTDISSGFLSTAREAFSECGDMHCSVLDIEEDPLKHGYEADYDLVVASECLHATTSISKTLEHCRKLLKPGGQLVLVENIRTVIGHGLVLGTLAGYWSGISDDRVDSPFLSLDGWDSALKQAGFSGTEVALNDYPPPFTVAATIVSRVIEPSTHAVQEDDNGQHDAGEVTFIYVSSRPALLDKLSAEYERRGVMLRSIHISDMGSLPANSRYIVHLDDGDLLINADAAPLDHIQELVRSCSTMVWITAAGMIRGKNPNAGAAAGLLRTIGTENPTSRFLFIDVDPDSDVNDDNLSRSIVDKEVELQNKTSTGEMEDHEFAWQDGCLWVSRLAPDAGLATQLKQAAMSSQTTAMLPFGRHGPVRAAFETPGLLASLYFKPYDDMWKPLPADWIQVKVAAVGLNWKDLAVSSGRFDINTFSSEFSGEVAAVGSAVSGLKVGDRVYGAGVGHFGNYVRTPARLAQRMEPEDDFVQMASIPLVYMTAVYAFEHATRIKQGEKVLIQTASGGLGLAAIQLARSMGAEVFATVGSPHKARYLIENMGIPESRIFSSRDIAAIPKLIRASGGRGFDVILGTATGDMLHESFKAVAPLGRYIDVGRVDVQNSATLGLELFQKSAAFVSFDLKEVADANPAMGGILMDGVDKHLRTGDIGPIPTISASDVSQLDQALLSFSKGTHIGKFVVTFLNPDSLVKMVAPVPRAQFESEAQYIITGGLGGLGRTVVNWMVDRGARHFLIISRSGGNGPEAQTLLERLEAQDISVNVARCDVSRRDEVLDTIATARLVRPIKGIVHAAVSYEDLSFNKLSADKWNSGLAAKVLGTKNLHEATKDLPLDFFVMTTSIQSVLSLATQSAYIAANSFQEQFARYRRRQGLPASTTSFGLITDVGHLSTNATTLNLMARNKTLGLTEVEFLQIFELAFLKDDGPTIDTAGPWMGATGDDDPLSAAGIIACMDPAALAAQRLEEEAATGDTANTVPRWYSDGRVSLVMRAFEDALRHEADDKTGSSKDGDRNSAVTQLRERFEESIKAGPQEQASTEALVTGAIVKAVADMLFVDSSSIDASKTVAAYGVDSLIAAELRNWFNTVFRADISMLDLLDTKNSITVLAVSIVDKALGAW